MNKIVLAVLMILIAGTFSLASAPLNNVPVILLNDSIYLSDTCIIKSSAVDGKITYHINSIDSEKKKKLISAMLSFPFPFGFMGAHRIMLGCKPWIPVVYMATFGGCFGLLPMIDFCAILFSKDLKQFENNPHVFMWLK
jgi:TM2 domain-containing membrane protein YozV